MKVGLPLLTVLVCVQGLGSMRTRQGDEEGRGQTMVYVKDEDERVEIAVGLMDALQYANTRVRKDKREDGTRTLQTQGETYMTGDLFDNHQTDKSKLEIESISGSGLTWADFDDDSSPSNRPPASAPSRYFTDMSQSYRVSPGDISPEPRDTDELLIESADRGNFALIRLIGTVNSYEGDLYEYTDKDGVPVMYAEGREASIRGDRTDNAKSDSVPLVLRVERPPEREEKDRFRDPEVVERTVPTEEMRGVDRENSAGSRTGERVVGGDREQVPIYHSTDPSLSMTGDLFNNKRTDSDLLTITAVTPAPPPPILPPVQPSTTLEKIDLKDIKNVDLTLISAHSDYQEQAILTEAIPYYAGSKSDIMVGDLFDNQRSDRSKLTVLRLIPEQISAVSVLNEGNSQQISRPFTVTAAPIHFQPLDIDDFQPKTPENVSQNPENGVFSPNDFDEFIPTLPVLLPDEDENYDSPYDFGINSTPDTDDLRTGSDADDENTANLPQNPVIFTDFDEFSPGNINGNRGIGKNGRGDEDENWSYDFDLSGNSPLSRLLRSKPVRNEMQTAANSIGNRRAFTDAKAVPTYYSSDTSPSLGGDLFDNHRSDTTRLLVLEAQGSSLKWLQSSSANPGFLQ